MRITFTQTPSALSGNKYLLFPLHTPPNVHVFRGTCGCLVLKMFLYKFYIRIIGHLYGSSDA